MQLHAIIYGKVQGVGFRYFTKNMANSLGVKGWVRNNPDGTVELVAEADKETLDKFLKKLWIGPPLSNVENIKYEFKEEEGGFRSFEIRY